MAKGVKRARALFTVEKAWLDVLQMPGGKPYFVEDIRIHIVSCGDISAPFLKLLSRHEGKFFNVTFSIDEPKRRRRHGR